jgi:hypothetical protein
VALFPGAYMAYIEPVLEAERSADRVRTATERLSVLAASPVPVDSMPDRGPAWRIFAIVPVAFLVAFLIGRGSRIPLRG